MDESIKVGLQEELIADLTIELQKEPTFDSTVLTQKVVNAIREVKKERKYPSFYTSEQIEKDLSEFYSNIRSIALYDYNKMGAEGEESHSENGIARSYLDRKSLFNGVLPLTKL